MEHSELTKEIIGAAYAVYNEMGFGFLESVYESCMVLALTECGLVVLFKKQKEGVGGAAGGLFDAVLLVTKKQ